MTVPILLHFEYFEPHKTEHRKYITDNVSAWLYWAAANLLISWYLALIIDLVPHIATFFVDIVWGELTEGFKSNMELYAASKGSIKPLFYAASGWLSWSIIFTNIFKLYDPNDESKSKAAYTPRV